MLDLLAGSKMCKKQFWFVRLVGMLVIGLGLEHEAEVLGNEGQVLGLGLGF